MSTIGHSFFVVAVLILTACASISEKNMGHVLRLETVEKLKIAKTDRKEAQALVGKPSKVVLFKESSEEIWLYFEGKYNATRLSLSFDSETGHLQTIGWFVRENDSEAELEKAKRRYQEASFSRKEPKWVNSHAGPDEVYFLDQKLGLEIQYGKNRQKVKSITWRPLESMREISENNSKPATKYEL